MMYDQMALLMDWYAILCWLFVGACVAVVIGGVAAWFFFKE
jgi:putative effector of murein hydrolase